MTNLRWEYYTERMEPKLRRFIRANFFGIWLPGDHCCHPMNGKIFRKKCRTGRQNSRGDGMEFENIGRFEKKFLPCFRYSTNALNFVVEINRPTSLDSLRGVEFFPHGKRGERGRSARWISSLGSVYSYLIWFRTRYAFVIDTVLACEMFNLPCEMTLM